MSKVIKNCRVFGCESKGVVDVGEDENRDDDGTVYICSGCMAVLAVFCEDRNTVSKETKTHGLVRLDDSTVRAICTDTDDGIFR